MPEAGVRLVAFRERRRMGMGGGEGSRTPVRNAIYAGFYTFSGSSGVSEALG